MPAPENPKVGGCYVWFISLLLFVFTIAGAIFLVLYIIQPVSSPSAYWYPIIGVSLVCFPWFFWLLTFLYRIISRIFGFRFNCFRPFGSGYPGNDEIAPPPNACGPDVSTSGGEEGEIGNLNRESEVPMRVGSPRRVHFGGVVILGDENENVNNGNPNSENSRGSLSKSSSSSSSSSAASNESEMPLKLSMAS